MTDTEHTVRTHAGSPHTEAGRGPVSRSAADTRPSAVPESTRPDEGTWPGLATPPHSPVRARIAESLFRRAVHGLPVRVALPGGENLGAGGPESPVMRLHDPAAFFHRVGRHGNIGFGESYLAGDWSSSDLAELLTPFADKLSTLIPPALHRLRRLAIPRAPLAEQNSIDGARRNIHRHYDLSNELFATFLDETMSYSSAWFAEGRDGESDLVEGQHRKIDTVLDLAGVRAGQHVLEIGTGWGELAIRAAGRGARVTTLTISTEQKELAERRIAEAGVADRVQVLLRDYREAHGSYDAVVSVEMIEAVGAEYWPTYFAALDRLLAPGGRVGLQAITIAHERLVATRTSYSWIHKYIFPGGLIPSITSIEQNLAAHTTLRIEESHAIGRHYARTLEHWRTRFLERWPEVSALGFDDTFRRMWELYLAYCEAGFRCGYLNVHQLSLSRSTGRNRA
jgi:cyclopropane-fatty-acyl-phospholipid synthase